MEKKTVLLFAYCVVLGTGCAQHSLNQSSANNLASSGDWRRQPLVFLDRSPDKFLKKNESAVVFYRPKNKTEISKPEPINVYLNHNYVASLLPKGYSVVSGCAGEVTVTAAFNDVTAAYGAKKQGGYTFEMLPQQVKYMEVRMQNEVASYSVVSEEQFLKNSGLEEQVHTIQRIKSVNCDIKATPQPDEQRTATPTEALPNAPEVSLVNNQAELSAQSVTDKVEGKALQKIDSVDVKSKIYFDFAKSDYMGVTPESKQTLSELGTQLNSSGINIKAVVLNGFADTVGDAASNKALSNRRVNTIKHLLIDLGVAPQVIQTHALGETASAAFCGRRSSVISRNQCNVGNRRVEIKVVQQ